MTDEIRPKDLALESVLPSMAIIMPPMLVVVTGFLSSSRDTVITITAIHLVTTLHSCLISFHMKIKYIFNLMKNIIKNLIKVVSGISF